MTNGIVYTPKKQRKKKTDDWYCHECMKSYAIGFMMFGLVCVNKPSKETCQHWRVRNLQ